MTINGEEVELVTDFATLRVGMIVWVTRCGQCGRDERMMLTSKTSPGQVSYREDGGIDRDDWGFFFAPDAACMGPGLRVAISIMSPCFVERRLYRVVDPKLTQTTERKREAVRT